MQDSTDVAAFYNDASADAGTPSFELMFWLSLAAIGLFVLVAIGEKLLWK